MYSISTVIPAYNEEKTIGNVLAAVKEVDLIDNIIVVNDGSSDDTSIIANSYDDVKVLELPYNMGKAMAIKKGVEKSYDDIILLLDADLVGINPAHITNLLLPILKDDIDMTLGVFNNGRFITDLGQLLTPYLTGQREIKRRIIEELEDIHTTRFGIEIAITEYANNNKLKTKVVILENVTHLLKEEKMGVIKGLKERTKMYLDILKYKRRSSLRN